MIVKIEETFGNIKGIYFKNDPTLIQCEIKAGDFDMELIKRHD